MEKEKRVSASHQLELDIENIILSFISNGFTTLFHLKYNNRGQNTHRFATRPAMTPRYMVS